MSIELFTVRKALVLGKTCGAAKLYPSDEACGNPAHFEVVIPGKPARVGTLGEAARASYVCRDCLGGVVEGLLPEEEP